MDGGSRVTRKIQWLVGQLVQDLKIQMRPNILIHMMQTIYMRNWNEKLFHYITIIGMGGQKG